MLVMAGSLRLDLYRQIIESPLEEVRSEKISEYMDITNMAMALNTPPSTWLVIDVTDHFFWDCDYWRSIPLESYKSS